MLTGRANFNNLLLVLPVHLVESGGRRYVEQQTYNGFRLWLENFHSVTIACVLKEAAVVTPNMIPIDTLSNCDRLTIIPLPDASKPFAFFRHLPSVIMTLRSTIGQSHYLCFMVWGLWGDWGSIACLIASRLGRNYVVWTDTVSSLVLAIQAERRSGLRKIYMRTIAGWTAKYEKYVIGKSTAGLFHGMDTFKHYAPFSRNPQLVHNIHLGPEYRIKPEELSAKLARRATPLRIIYAGRAHSDKGILEWLETLAKLKAAKIDFHATWFGHGPEFDDALSLVGTSGLGANVFLPGPLNNRELLLEKIRAADIFMFCHKTPESPRCLLESLLSGTPIVGYKSHYSQDLISAHGGGVLVPQSPKLLAEAVKRLANNRGKLADLQQRAAKDGFPMTDEKVFQHRSQLLRELID